MKPASEKVAGLERLKWCPTQFQQYVSGVDYRVHVVGDDIHTTCISAADDDYRYAGGTVDLRGTQTQTRHTAASLALRRAFEPPFNLVLGARP
jgi:hypothetical protein